MRIGIGKRMGSFYVGTSMSTKGIGKVLWYLIASPFYLIYYVCIWPFVAIYRLVTKKKKVNKRTWRKRFYSKKGGKIFFRFRLGIKPPIIKSVVFCALLPARIFSEKFSMLS